MQKLRLWRVDISSQTGCQAPSLYVESTSVAKHNNEQASLVAIKLAKEKSGLSRFPKSWNFTAVHMADHFQLDGRWARRSDYFLQNGKWMRYRPFDEEEEV